MLNTLKKYIFRVIQQKVFYVMWCAHNVRTSPKDRLWIRAFLKKWGFGAKFFGTCVKVQLTWLPSIDRKLVTYPISHRSECGHKSEQPPFFFFKLRQRFESLKNYSYLCVIKMVRYIKDLTHLKVGVWVNMKSSIRGYLQSPNLWVLRNKITQLFLKKEITSIVG